MEICARSSAKRQCDEQQAGAPTLGVFKLDAIAKSYLPGNDAVDGPVVCIPELEGSRGVALVVAAAWREKSNLALLSMEVM